MNPTVTLTPLALSVGRMGEPEVLQPWIDKTPLGHVAGIEYSQLSLSRLRLSRITAYLEEKNCFNTEI